MIVAPLQFQEHGGLVYAKGNRFLAEVASTTEEQALGLMFRKDFDANRAMFFYCSTEGFRTVWMKNCRVSLDVVWLDRNGTVVEIAEHCPPCLSVSGDCPTYGGAEISRHVVEFLAGTVKRISLKKGDRMGWDLFFIDGTAVSNGMRVEDSKKVTVQPKTKGKFSR